jgi:hypothetical protein
MDRGRTVFKDNDSWFKLDIKFRWKDAPKHSGLMENQQDYGSTVGY